MTIDELRRAKSAMVKSVWNAKKDYYDKTEGGNAALLAGPHYQRILPYLHGSRKILEVGCGDGGALKTLHSVLGPKTALFGCDISALAIKRARKKFRAGTFAVADGNTLPYKANTFDATVSFFTFEHVIDPYEILLEMTRVTKSEGIICIICPNYGSPIYPSPCSIRPIPLRFLDSLLQGKTRARRPQFGWSHVLPIADGADLHSPDHDTMIEPNLATFVSAISEGAVEGLTLLDATSHWETVRFHASKPLFFASLPLRLAAMLYGAPFAYWGPLFVAVLRVDKKG